MQFVESLNRRIQYIFGGLVFIISFLVYYSTVAPTTSFWDCGEFIASSYILGVIHPPGAPLYLLIGRIMTMLPFFEDIGLRVNMFTVFISAATVFLTFLIIVQLIRRWRGEARTWEDLWIMYGSALFGALAFAFTDSHWFNAVEAEVYGFSIFFTALVIWLALLWGERSEKTGSMLLIFFIFYLFGLAAGVHLLNILAFPFVLLIAYFHHNQSVRNLLMLIIIQGIVPITLYILIYQYDPEKMGVNMLEHQAQAWNFLKWFGGIWVVITLMYMYYKDRKAFAAWWVLPVLVIVGYSTYLMIYVRAGMNPPINENNPSTFQAMMDYLGRKQYGQESMLLTFLYRKADFWNYQIQMMYTRYFGWQFIGKGIAMDYHDRLVDIISVRGLYGLPFFVGVWGAVHHFSRDWKRAVAVLVFFLITGYAIIIYLNQPDPQPRERDYSYVGSFFAFALWIGIGMAGILEWISEAVKDRIALKKAIFGLVTIILLIIVPVNLIAFNYESHNRSGNYVAYDYSYNILQTCEPNAIIFTNGDNDTFPLWYLQEVEGIRKDVRVVNLSLLNTPWYIYQLRDEEPKVPIRLKNREIDEINYRQWESQDISIPVPPQIREREADALLGTDQNQRDASKTMELNERKKILEGIPDKITFRLEPTYPENNPMVLRVQDLMILRILYDNMWQRPVYFAVTVANNNMINLDSYLRMDGLAFRVMPYEVNDNVNPDVLHRNILEKYQYRGLNDPSVHLNTNILKLLGNYRSAFIRLAQTYQSEGERDLAVEVYQTMDELMPPEKIYYPSELTAMLLNKVARDLGMDVDIEERIKNVIPGRIKSKQETRETASYAAYVFRMYDYAEEVLNELIEDDPNDMRTQSELFYLYRQSGQYERAVAFLEEWLQQNPGDPNAKKELESLMRLMGNDTTTGSTADMLP
ncbi:DUF2723 domain-containing protein [bacterium]|nr:DUF2723 domain-containing protein [bacterium]